MTRTTHPDSKLVALVASGTVNPHAQDVKDAVFIGSDFFDARDLVQVRYEMLRRVRTDGQTIAEVAARFGVSRPTFYKVQAAFNRDGLPGLLPVKRGPHGPHKITDDVWAFIAAAIAVEEGLDAQVLVERIAQHFGVTVHRRTVERALERRKKKRQQTLPRDARPPP
jgi:transposase